MADSAPERLSKAEGRLSVIVPVLNDQPDLEQAHHRYRAALEPLGQPVEFVYVLGRGAERAATALRALKDADEPLTAIVLSRWDGEAAALKSGLRYATGTTILTLPAAPQVEAEDLPDLVQALDGCDMAAASRTWPGGSTSGLESSLFHRLIRALFGQSFNDLGCRVRACRRQVLEEVGESSAQPHFLPLLASARGFKVREVALRGTAGASTSLFKLGSRLRLALDVLALFMVLKFVRRPLRFFGAIGVPILVLGVLYTGWLAFSKLAFGVALADRPALILGVLMIVLGIQVIALGLMGEIIIFASGRRIKDYDVERIA
ncbi:MAG: glycosyltransferase [Kiloniellales bacterium]|nr:glycosyltransferase [Kiloniellales bacterium]